MLAVLLGAATQVVNRLPSAVRTGAGGVLVVILAVLGTLTWRQAGVYRNEITFFSHIVALNPEARDAHLNLMGPLADAGRPEEALAAGRTGAAQRPGSANIHANLGRVLIRLDRLDEAEAALRTALGIAPRHLNANQNLGEALRRQGRYAEAIEAYRRVLAIDDSHVGGNGALGIALFHSGHYADAIAPLDKALELEPDVHSTSELALYAGRAALRLDRIDEALGLSAPGAGVAAERPPDTRQLGRGAREGKTECGGDGVVPGNPADRSGLRVRPGRPGCGVVQSGTLRRSIGIADPRHGTGHRSGNGGDGTLPGRPDPAGTGSEGRGAAAQFERTLERDPNHVDALDYLAHLRFGQKKYEDALGLYRTQATLKPGSVTVHANIGVTLYYLGRHAEALESMEHVLRLDPDHQMARKMAAQLRKGNR